MKTKKEVWESAISDRLPSMGNAELLELRKACEWYAATSARLMDQMYFRAKADVIEIERVHRQDKSTRFAGKIGAIISLIGAAASWAGVWYSRASPSSQPERSSTAPEYRQSIPQMQPKISKATTLPASENKNPLIPETKLGQPEPPKEILPLKVA